MSDREKGEDAPEERSEREVMRGVCIARVR